MRRFGKCSEAATPKNSPVKKAVIVHLSDEEKQRYLVKIASLKDQLKTAGRYTKEQFDIYEQHIKDLEKQIQERKSENADNEEQYKTLDREMMNVLSVMNEMRSEIQLKELAIAEKESELASVKKRLESIQEEVAMLREQKVSQQPKSESKVKKPVKTVKSRVKKSSDRKEPSTGRWRG